MVVNVVVGTWGASSEVFLRPLYAVKGLPSYFCYPSFFCLLYLFAAICTKPLRLIAALAIL